MGALPAPRQGTLMTQHTLHACTLCTHTRRMHRPRCACGCMAMTRAPANTPPTAPTERSSEKFGAVAGRKSEVPSGRGRGACPDCKRKRGHKDNCPQSSGS